MAEIVRYVLVLDDGEQDDFEYQTLDEAVREAKRIWEGTGKRYAVYRRTYTRGSSEVAWTPSGALVWPPPDDDPENPPISVTFIPCVTVSPEGDSFKAEWDWSDSAVNVVLDNGTVLDAGELRDGTLAKEFYDRACTWADSGGLGDPISAPAPAEAN